MKFLCLLFLSFNLKASTVLFIGDSHSVGPFGQALDLELRQSGHRVTTAASCGSIASWWITGKKTNCGFFSKDSAGQETRLPSAQTPQISLLLQESVPDTIIVELGGNYLVNPTEESVKADLTRLLSVITEADLRCFWVSHPDTRNHRTEIPRIMRILKETVEPYCTLFDSTLVTRYPETGGDGTHYWNSESTPLAKTWAKKVAEAFSQTWNLK